MRSLFESIHDTMVFATKDWSVDKNDAWIYGIVCGWDEPSYAELRRKLGWSQDTVNRNMALRLEWLRVEREYLKRGETHE